MAKRKSKQERDDEQRDMLRQRLSDLFTGATGDEYDGESEPWPEPFMAFCQATKRAFCVLEKDDEDGHGNEYLWNIWNLDKFRTPDHATDHLFDAGVRA